MGKNEEGEEIAAKIQYLFDTYRKPNGDKYNYLEVDRLTDGKVDNSWLSKLGKGKVTRPGLTVLKAITNFFGVEPDFWFKDLDDWVAEQNEKRNQNTRQEIATRAGDLPEEAQQIIFDLVDSFEKRLGNKRRTRNEQ